MMKIKITETGEFKDLTIFDEFTQTEVTEDVLCTYDKVNYDNDIIALSQEQFNWWHEYIEHRKQNEQEIAKLAEDLHITEFELWERINAELTNDLEDENIIIQRVLKEFKQL